MTALPIEYYSTFSFFVKRKTSELSYVSNNKFDKLSFFRKINFVKRLINVFLLICLLLTMVCCQRLSHQTFNGQQYFKIENRWKVYYKGQYYNIEPNNITIRYNLSVTSSQIITFESNNGLIRLRSNILGYYDYQIASLGSVDNIFNIANNLQNSSLTDEVIIVTYGKLITIPDDTQQ